MALAPSPLQDTFFSNHIEIFAAKAKNCWKVVELQTMELEVKERSLQLQEALSNTTDSPKKNALIPMQIECNGNKSFEMANSSCASPKKISHLLQLLESELIVLLRCII